jgi:hypothetical protein
MSDKQREDGNSNQLMNRVVGDRVCHCCKQKNCHSGINGELDKHYSSQKIPLNVYLIGMKTFLVIR